MTTLTAATAEEAKTATKHITAIIISAITTPNRGGGAHPLTATRKDKKASHHHHHHHHHALSYCFLLAAAFVVITATVSFQHDTPPQAAYAALGDSLSSLRDDDAYVIQDMISNPNKGPMGIAFNSTGWMFVANFVPVKSASTFCPEVTSWFNETQVKACEDKVDAATDEELQEKTYEWKNTISIFDPDGNYVKRIGSIGKPEPANIGENIYCKVYDPDRINKSNWKNGRCWWAPADIAVDANDNIYVTSAFYKYQIQIFDPNWKFIKRIDVRDSSNNHVDTPWGVYVGGPNNYVYIAHQHARVITVFDPHVDNPSKEAEQIYMIGSQYRHPVDLKYDDFLFSMSIAVDDSTGRIFAASGQNWNSEIHIFDPVTDPDTGETYYVFVKNIDFDFNTAMSVMVMNDPHPLSPNKNSLFVAERSPPHGSFVVFDNDGENPQQFKFNEEDFEHISHTHGFKSAFGVAVHPLTNQVMVSINGYNTIVALGPGSPSGSSSSNNNNGGSNDFDYITAPTFGLSHDTRSSPESRLIDSGISLNGLALDVGSFHTEFAKQILQTGQDNTLSTKVKTSTGGYGGLKIIEFFYGVPSIGVLSQAEGSIEVHIDPYDRGEFPEITDIAIRDDKHSLLSQGNTTVTVQRVDCINGDAKKGCYKIDIGFVFANAPVGEVFALQATDSRGWSTVEYFNDGFEVQGAPLIPVTMSIAADLARGAGKGSTEITQIDRKKDLWLSADDNTTLYTKNDFGFWKKLTPDKPLNRCSQDTEYDTKEWNVMTRMHCLHGAQTESEAKRAKSVFNSSAIQKEIPDSFAYEPPLAVDHRSALLHKLGWITTDDVIKRLELSGKYDHMDGQQLKDKVHQLLLLDEDEDADAVDIADASNVDAGAAAPVTPGPSTAVIDKLDSEIHFLKEQFDAHTLILAQIHSALADLSDGLTQQKQELEMHNSKIDALWSDKNSANENEFFGAMSQQQQQHALLYFLPLLSAALTAVVCLFYFRRRRSSRHVKAKTKAVQVMTGEQQQQLKNYDNDDDYNDAESQLQQMQQKLEEKHQKLKQDLEERHHKLQQTQHEKLQQTQQKLEELQESRQRMQESEHKKLQQTQQKLEELQESKQKMQHQLEEKQQKMQQQLEEKQQKMQQQLEEKQQKMQQQLEEKQQKMQQTQHEKLQQTQQKLEELQESKQQMQQQLEEKQQQMQQTQHEKLQQTQQKLEELQESKQQMQQQLEEKQQQMQQTQHEKLQQTQQKLEELQESKQKTQQELEEKHQEQQNTPADLNNNAEIYKKIDELLNQTKRK